MGGIPELAPYMVGAMLLVIAMGCFVVLRRRSQKEAEKIKNIAMALGLEDEDLDDLSMDFPPQQEVEPEVPLADGRSAPSLAHSSPVLPLTPTAPLSPITHTTPSGFRADSSSSIPFLQSSTHTAWSTHSPSSVVKKKPHRRSRVQSSGPHHNPPPPQSHQGDDDDARTIVDCERRAHELTMRSTCFKREVADHVEYFKSTLKAALPPGLSDSDEVREMQPVPARRTHGRSHTTTSSPVYLADFAQFGPSCLQSDHEVGSPVSPIELSTRTRPPARSVRHRPSEITSPVSQSLRSRPHPSTQQVELFRT